MLAIGIGIFAAVGAAASVQVQSTSSLPAVGDPSTFVPPVVGGLTTTTPDVSHVQEQAIGIAKDAVSGELDTSDIGPASKCDILAPIGQPIPAYSSECPLPGPGTTTPPGGPDTTTPPGEPGTTTPPVDNGGGGSGSTPPGDGVGGGGDASEPSGGSAHRSSSGGNGGGGGEVLGASAPGGMGGGGDVPGAPQAGAGGQAPMTLMLLLSSFAAMLISGAYWRSLSKVLIKSS